MTSSNETRDNPVAIPNVPWRAGEVTDVGRKRDHNEDCLGSQVPADPAQLARRGALYVIADGMGGHNAGEVASRIALDTTIEAYYAAAESLPNAVALRQAIQQANVKAYQKSQESPDVEGMGTTLVAAVVQLDGTLLVANVGDSRAYLVREGRATKLSVDHTWVAEQVAAGILTGDEAKTHKRRHQITRSLGRRTEVEIDLSTHRLMAGDALLLCSDGLSDVVEDHEIALYAVQGEPQGAAEALMHLANERGGPDNISVSLVRYSGLPAPKKASWPISVAVGVPLALIVAAVVLVLLGVIKNPFAGQGAATPEQSATPSVTPAESAGLVGTSTLDAAASAPARTPTPSAVAAASETPTAPEQASRGPTSTLLATSTLLPTATPAPSSTSRGGMRYSKAPELTEPAASTWNIVVQNDSVTLKWTFSPKLALTEEYEVRVWYNLETIEDASKVVGRTDYASERTRDKTLTYKMTQRGQYWWTVVVVGPSLAGLHAELSPLAQPRWFGWANETAKPTETLRPIIQTTWTPPKD